MLTKVCIRCKEEKPLSEYYRDKSLKYGRRNHCKICDFTRIKLYRKKNSIKIKVQRKEFYDNVVKLKNRRRQHWLNKYKISKGCKICGYNEHPAALHFDHVIPKEKYSEVSRLISSSLKILIDEIRKCRVLCANCHFIHSHNQRKKE